MRSRPKWKPIGVFMMEILHALSLQCSRSGRLFLNHRQEQHWDTRQFEQRNDGLVVVEWEHQWAEHQRRNRKVPLVPPQLLLVFHTMHHLEMCEQPPKRCDSMTFEGGPNFMDRGVFMGYESKDPFWKYGTLASWIRKWLPVTWVHQKATLKACVFLHLLWNKSNTNNLIRILCS